MDEDYERRTAEYLAAVADTLEGTPEAFARVEDRIAADIERHRLRPLVEARAQGLPAMLLPDPVELWMNGVMGSPFRAEGALRALVLVSGRLLARAELAEARTVSLEADLIRIEADNVEVHGRLADLTERQGEQK